MQGQRRGQVAVVVRSWLGFNDNFSFSTKTQRKKKVGKQGQGPKTIKVNKEEKLGKLEARERKFFKEVEKKNQAQIPIEVGQERREIKKIGKNRQELGMIEKEKKRIEKGNMDNFTN